MANPADLSVVEAASLLARRALSARELAQACLDRIRERDGARSFDGDPGSVNAWARVYEEDALDAAARADERLAAGDAPPLCGIPVGLKDLYAVAGKPLTASSRVLDEVPERSSDAWLRLEAAGAVLLGHTHTHEFAAGATTDQVGNPWALDRSAGGSSGGSAAALAARTVPAATGSDTAGSLRIPAALSGISTIKPTRGSLSLRGVVPLAPTLDHAGPMARTLADCGLLLAALTGPDAERPLTALLRGPEPSPRPPAGARIALSPRIGDLDADVADGLDAATDALRRLGARLLPAPPPELAPDTHDDYTLVLLADLVPYHRRFADRRDRYRPGVRKFVELAERQTAAAADYAAVQARRRELSGSWADWLAAERVDAVLEPTVPVVAPLRGAGYVDARDDLDLISLTVFWNWTGLPAVSLPAGVGSRNGLPVGVSLVGRAGSDWELLALGAALQAELGTPQPPALDVP